MKEKNTTYSYYSVLRFGWHECVQDKNVEVEKRLECSHKHVVPTFPFYSISMLRRSATGVRRVPLWFSLRYRYFCCGQVVGFKMADVETVLMLFNIGDL